MNVTELIQLVRLQALIEPTNVDYTDNVILRELAQALWTTYERPVLDAKANYWIQSFDYTTTQGQPLYRVPTRAIGVSKIELGGPNPSSTGFIRLPQIAESHISMWQSNSGSIGQPRRFILRGDRIQVDPAPDNSGYVLRVWYYVRPSRLIPFQFSGGSNVSGIIVALNTTTRVATLSGSIATYDFNYVSTGMASTTYAVDVCSGGGWRETQLVDASALFGNPGTTCTFAVGTDLTKIQVGDIVRAADQIDFPQIPEDYHRTLADIASAKILIQRDFPSKAQAYYQAAAQDYARFAQHIAQTRTTEEPYTHWADLPSLRGGRYWGSW